MNKYLITGALLATTVSIPAFAHHHQRTNQPSTTTETSTSGQSDTNTSGQNGTSTSGDTTASTCTPNPTGNTTQTPTPNPTPNPPTTSSGTINSIQQIADDMALPHEGYPHGVPSGWDWAQGPVVRPDANNPSTNFTAATGWFQVYRDTSDSQDTNTRVQVRNPKVWFKLKSTDQWKLMSGTPGVDGAFYVENFANDSNTASNAMNLSDGSSAAKLAHGHNWHFWPSSGRFSIDSTDIAGIVVTVQARLIVDDPSQTDDRDVAKYILDAGGDYWLSLSAAWQADYSANKDFGIARFKYVTNDWRAFNLTTLTLQELQANPVPIE